MNKTIIQTDVLKLNKNWQVIGVVSVRNAMEAMFSGTVTALNCEDGMLIPTRLKDWLNLPIRPQDDIINTVNRQIRVPRVIITLKFDKLIVRPPKLTLKNLRKRDKDTCVYSGKKLREEEMSIEHIKPLSKGGKNEWENVALAHRDINSKKSNKLPEEAGLSLKFIPHIPNPRTPAEEIQNKEKYAEWDMFLKA